MVWCSVRCEAGKLPSVYYVKGRSALGATMNSAGATMLNAGATMLNAGATMLRHPFKARHPFKGRGGGTVIKRITN